MITDQDVLKANKLARVNCKPTWAAAMAMFLNSILSIREKEKKHNQEEKQRLDSSLQEDILGNTPVHKTREEIESMTDEERRTRTALICFPEFPVFKRGRELRHQYNHRDGPVYNYPLDLNAMIEATQRLDATQHRLYRECLADIISADAGGTADDFDRAILDSTARQRNTAFLMTLL